MRRKKPSKVIFQGIESGMKVFRFAVLILVILFWLSGITSVQPQNVGLHTRFGKLITGPSGRKTQEPGALLALPYPIDEVIQIPRGNETALEVSEVWAALDLPVKNNKIDPLLEGYCLTGDLSVVQTRLVVKYVISDPEAYYFNLTDSEPLVRDTVLSSLRETVSSWSSDDVLKLQRVEPESGVVDKLDVAVKERAQKRLNEVESGIQLNGIEFINMHYPRHVNKYFENVQTARIQNETDLRNAEGYAGKLKHSSQAQRNTLIQQARAYAIQMTSMASAEQSDFTALYEEYRKAPKLVWQRIFMESMTQVWKQVGRLDFVPANSRVILPDTEAKQ